MSEEVEKVENKPAEPEKEVTADGGAGTTPPEQQEASAADKEDTTQEPPKKEAVAVKEQPVGNEPEHYA